MTKFFKFWPKKIRKTVITWEKELIHVTVTVAQASESGSGPGP